MLARLGAGQLSRLCQTAHSLWVHLQEVGRFLEVQGVHLAGSYFLEPVNLWVVVSDRDTLS